MVNSFAFSQNETVLTLKQTFFDKKYNETSQFKQFKLDTIQWRKILMFTDGDDNSKCFINDSLGISVQISIIKPKLKFSKKKSKFEVFTRHIVNQVFDSNEAKLIMLDKVKSAVTSEFIDLNGTLHRSIYIVNKNGYLLELTLKGKFHNRLYLLHQFDKIIEQMLFSQEFDDDWQN